jgi:hypothetical protein
LRDRALEKTIAHALAVDPRVDDDTIAVEWVAGCHVVCVGPPRARPRPRARCGPPTASPACATWRTNCGRSGPASGIPAAVGAPMVAGVEDEIRVAA